MALAKHVRWATFWCDAIKPSGWAFEHFVCSRHRGWTGTRRGGRGDRAVRGLSLFSEEVRPDCSRLFRPFCTVTARNGLLYCDATWMARAYISIFVLQIYAMTLQ